MMRLRGPLLCALLCTGMVSQQLSAAAPTEEQVKAVFVFNFSHFVEWPAGALGAPGQSFDICLLGADELQAELELAILGEEVAGQPLQLRRLDNAGDASGCRVLYLGQGAATQLEQAAQSGRAGMLTVSDLDDAARRGVMIQLARDSNRIRLIINVDAAQAAGLTISSNLLRPAEIIRVDRRD